jgi:hypothetical protein
MKNLLIAISLIILTSCSNDEEVVSDVNQIDPASSMKYIVSENYGNFNDLYSQEYTFDADGKVLTETFVNNSNPQHNYSSRFEYDSQGKLITEIKNGQVHHRIIWNGNIAELYNDQNQKISDFIFDGEKLTEYNYGFLNGTIINYKYNYDSSNNVISEETQNEVKVEYLNYDTSILNPMNKIKSIGILRLYYKPYFKNFFETEKVHPYTGDDYSFPLTYYDYQYTLDSNNRIVNMTNDKTLIYRERFEYN